MLGQVVSHYRVIDAIGRGGMGVVYKAEDLKLHRLVALKFLPDELAHDVHARERLQQEARAASSLNHPHICTIYDIDEDHQRYFIAMELLEGRTLDQCIGGRPLALDQTISLASQIASALEAAHAKGIIHRDLKPGNIFVVDRGDAKIMDFGLAKSDAGGAAGFDAATRLSALTQPGVVVGTATYMSPEQLRNEPLDVRSDLFAFGLILYEMTTGRHAFDQTTPAIFFDSVLNRTPLAPIHLNPVLPPLLNEIILKALDKDRTTRYQSAAEMAADLRRVARGMGAATGPLAVSSAAHAAPPTTRAARRLRVGVAAGAAVAAVVWIGLRVVPRSAPVPTLAGTTFSQLTDQPGPELLPTISPDGKLVAYVVRSEEGSSIFLQRVGGQKPIRLADGTQPAFSPDGEHIAFRAERDGGGVFVMGSTGESVRRLTDFGYNPAWSPDGTELVVATVGIVNSKIRTGNGQLVRVSLADGTRREVTRTDSDAVQPQWSPHNLRIAYWAKGERSGSLTIWTVPAAGGNPVRVTTNNAENWSPVWSPDGRLLYFLSNAGGTTNLWWVPIDESTGKVTTAPQVLTASSDDLANLAISHDGRRLVYAKQLLLTNLEAVSFDPDTHKIVGRPQPVTRLSKGSMGLDLSRDGDRIVFASAGQHEDLYVARSDGSALRQISDGTFKARLPQLSPDGSTVAFTGDRDGRPGIWLINVDGSGLRAATPGPHGPQAGVAWSPDGKQIAYGAIGQGVVVQDIRAADPPAPPRLLVKPASPAEFLLPWSWSPDARKIAISVMRPDNTFKGVRVYSFESREALNVSDVGGAPLWFADSRRLLITDQFTGRVDLVDTQSAKRDVLFTSALSRIDGSALSRDNRTLYLVLSALESDIWLLTLR